jgi:hypothetical protein
MTHPWDEFSKSLAEPVPRRESLRRLGLVFTGAALAPLSAALGAVKRGGQDPCKAFCNGCSRQTRSQCLAACQACNGNTSRLCGSCGNYVCCGSGQSCCDGHCTDLTNDFYNCGGCGNTCDPPGLYEDGACVNGTCLYECVPGATRCNGICTDMASDPNNCGACGNVCPDSAPYCNQGVCNSCPPGFVLCGGSCVDLSRDPGNCGACGNVCAADESCVYGACAPSGGEDCTPDSPYWPNCCPGGWTICGGACVYTYSDPYNCGACGNVCEPGFVCSSGACWDPACQFYDC